MDFNPERFIIAMDENNLSNEDLVNILENEYGIKITIDGVKSYRRKNGKNAKPTLDKLVAISEILKVSTDYLLGVDEQPSAPVKKIPIIGTASCGDADINHLQDTRGYAHYSGNLYNRELYAVIANGDSMSPEIEDGDQVICDPSLKPQNGDLVHYRIGNENAIKIFFEDEEGGFIQFVPYNQTEQFKTKTIRIDDDLINEVKISKVIAVNKIKFNNRQSRLKLIGRG